MDELVTKAKNGDKEAFTQIVIQIKDELYRIAKLRLKNDEDIYDAIQETMIEAFNSIKKLKKIEFFKTWIIRILINKCNDIYKKKKKENLVSYNEIQNDTLLNIHNLNDIDDSSFKLILNKLKYQDKTIIILYYQEGYTDKEISKILKLKENTVKTKRSRAKEQIRKFIESEMS